jgi:putative dimethyl sulfoxide reductase chaperone
MTSADRAPLRALAYRFLAGLYLDWPKAEWLAGLAAAGLLEEFPVPLGDERMVRGLSLIAGACREPDGQAFAADYQQLFVGPGHLPAPPWESVYRSDEHLVFDWPALEVSASYREMGLGTDQTRSPEDHIGLELLFMAIMAEREAAGEAGAAAVQASFLREHLLAWVPAFCDDVTHQAQTDLYRGLGLLTGGMLQQELNLLPVD